MIIWLASYPKSGNTWLRSFLNSLIFTDKGTLDLNNLRNIYQFPVRSQFKEIKDDMDNLKKLSINWIPVQKKINSDNKVRFFKTHHSLCNINGNSFTNTENTLGVIYVVRDPRNIITSILYHYSKSSYDEAKEFMFDEKKIIGRNFDEAKDVYKDNDIITLISSWKNHYNSWKNFPKNFLLIKYEDLIKNERKELYKLTKYLSQILKIKFTENKIERCIKNNSFEKLKNAEKEKGFVESPQDKISGQKKKFFNSGPKNKWENLLKTNIRNDIETMFKNEMKELNYL